MISVTSGLSLKLLKNSLNYLPFQAVSSKHLSSGIFIESLKKNALYGLQAILLDNFR